ncbi:MAG: alcohol dehydrogenase catalytic domain-containing protein [Desulfurococcaceae archaeon]
MVRGRVAFFVKPREPLVIKEVEFPEPRYDEVLIKVKAVGVCHTDLATIDGEFPPPPLMPTVLGHEIAGEIVSTGEGVKTAKPGDRVVLSWLWYTCGKCKYCTRGDEQLCDNLVETGRHVYGGYAEYVVAKASHVLPIPENVPWEYAPAATDAIATPFKGLRVAGAKEGDVVAVWGIGSLGFNAIQVAKAKGCTVIGLGRSEVKLKKALEVGADHVVNMSKEDPVKRILELTGGVDVALQLVPTDIKTYEQAFYSLRKGGKLVLLGYPPGNLCLPVIEWGLTERWVIASLAFTRYDISESLRLLSQGKVKPVITVYRGGLDRIHEALDDLRKGKALGRPVILFD